MGYVKKASLPTKNILLAGLPVVADGAALLLHVLLLPPVTAHLQNQSGINVLLLGGAYLLFCAAVYLLRKLKPSPGKPTQLIRLVSLGPKTRGLLGILFGMAVMTAVAHQLGFFDAVLMADPMVLGEGEAAVFYVFAPSAWLGLSFFYIIVLAFDVKPSIQPGTSKYAWLTLLGLLGSHAMLLLVTAQVKAVLAPLAIAPLSAGGTAGLFLLAFSLLLLLFGPPRLIYLVRQPHPVAIGSFLLLSGYCARWIVA